MINVWFNEAFVPVSVQISRVALSSPPIVLLRADIIPANLTVI